MGSTAKKLMPRHRRFVEAYLANGFVGSAAAREAGYAVRGAGTEACDLLKRPEIREAIEQHLRDAGITRERVLHELALMAFSADLADFEELTDGGVTLRQLREKGINTRMISKLTVLPGKGRRKRYKVELFDRMRAIEQIAKVLGLFGDDKPTNSTTSDVRQDVRDMIESTIGQ